MTETLQRLLSPTKRRIFTIDNDVTTSIITGSQLQAVFGWTLYTGPAKTDRLGFVIRGSDPTVVATPMKRRT